MARAGEVGLTEWVVGQWAGRHSPSPLPGRWFLPQPVDPAAQSAGRVPSLGAGCPNPGNPGPQHHTAARSCAPPAAAGLPSSPPHILLSACSRPRLLIPSRLPCRGPCLAVVGSGWGKEFPSNTVFNQADSNFQHCQKSIPTIRGSRSKSNPAESGWLFGCLPPPASPPSSPFLPPA